MRKSLLTLALFGLAVGGSTACATKGFVKTQVNQVSTKVDSLSQSLEDTQQRTQQNASKINGVDQKADAANSAANTAQNAAVTADQHAAAANSEATKASAQAEAVDKASKRMVYEVVLSENEGNFKFGQAELPDAAKAKIDEMVTQLKADPKGAYFENRGPHRQRRPEVGQREDRVGPRRRGQAVSVRAPSDSAAPHQRHQLRRREASRPEHHA